MSYRHRRLRRPRGPRWLVRANGPVDVHTAKMLATAWRQASHGAGVLIYDGAEFTVERAR